MILRYLTYLPVNLALVGPACRAPEQQAYPVTLGPERTFALNTTG